MADVDLSDRSLWSDEAAVAEAFARLRRDDPVSWQREAHAPGVDAAPGYWAVVRHRDIVTVSTDPATFSSAQGTSIRTLPPAVDELLGSMLNTDDPRHAQLRRIVSRTFTPKRLDRLNTYIDQLADRLVTEAAEAAERDGEVDLVAAVATPLPLQVICELMGIPPADRDLIASRGALIGTARDAKVLLAAASDLAGCAAELAAARRARPGDDVVSALVHANIDGEQLTATEIGSFFVLLVVAGVQTAQHAIGTGIVALDRHPDERERWIADFDAMAPTAVDELIRWASPVRHFRRTATTDTELGGVPIREGDKVVVWYPAANRDESVFEQPDRLDLTRTPNPHLGFGIGPHFCLGAALARREMTATFRSLLRRHPHYVVTRAEALDSAFMAGHRSVICRF